MRQSTRPTTRRLPRAPRPPRPPRPPRRTRPTRRPLRLLLRSPDTRRVVGTTLTVLTIGMLVRATNLANERAATWGATTSVVLAQGNHRAGDRLGPGDGRVASIPTALAPRGALHSLPHDTRLMVDIGDGEILVRRHVAVGASSTLAARVPRGQRAMTVPLGPSGMRLTVGDRVDLLAPGPDGHTVVVADDARVVQVAESAATVAIPSDRIGAATDAALAQTLLLTLRGPQPDATSR